METFTIKKVCIALSVFLVVLLFTSIFSYGEPQQLSSTLHLNATQVWWGEAILANGYMTKDGQPVSGTLNLSLEGKVYCENIDVVDGYWECSFYAPTEIKKYTVTIHFTDNLEFNTNSTTLTVAPFYGLRPTRSASSFIEQHTMIQDLNGKIKRVKLLLSVWR